MRRTPWPAFWLLLPALASSGCARKSSTAALTSRFEESELLMKCVDHAAPVNPRPPACDLPTAAEVALSCAVQDTVSAPGYEPPLVDESGFPSGGTPAPEYRIDKLHCRFTTSEHNAASCTFDVENRATARKVPGRTVSFEHVSWNDNGPAHHVRWTFWRAAGRCIPLTM
ncbi:hypothetical protein MZO42_00345 [Sphingomonas psychrotolerans]|uniref:Lipoprotein n=1 Tax=Sphingomonas psychrotolerans TaxID=1327635 RepID=A0ABU3MZU3_9SPHN|nr:hypothetical protein [Sphingomonas psychrotolerans]MDT8757134.1 hypothetical protein [Sphingomonas psychrotolerans]